MSQFKNNKVADILPINLEQVQHGQHLFYYKQVAIDDVIHGPNP